MKFFIKSTVFKTFFSNIFIQILTVLQGIYISRLLGPEGRGEIAAIILWPTFMSTIFSLGLKTGIGVLAAKKNKNLYFSTIKISLITGVLGYLFSFFSLPYLLGEENMHLLKISRVFSLVIIVNHIAANLLSIDHGEGNFDKYNFLRSILNPIYILLLFILYVIEQVNIVNIIYSLLIANCIVLAVRFSMIFKKISFLDNYPVKEIFKKSFSFGFADFFNPLYQYIDKIILLWLIGTIDLGYYSVSSTVSAVLGTLSSAIALIAFTKLAQDKNNIRYVVEVFKNSFITYILLAVIYALCIPFLVNMVYGVSFSNSILPAQILLIAALFQGQGNILEQSLRGDNKPFIGLSARVVSIVVMVLVGYVLGVNYGLVGVCIAFVIAQLIFLTSMIFLFKKNFCYHDNLLPKFNDLILIIKKIRYNEK